MDPKERAILTTTCYGHFMSHFNMLVFPAVLLPLSSSYGLSVSETLSLSFLMYLLFGITALPWGLAADKFGSKTLLCIFHAGAGACAIGAGLNSANPQMFSLCLTGIGLFSGVYHPAGLGWLGKAMTKTSRAMAYNGMAGNLGLAMAPLIAGVVFYFWGLTALYLLVGVMNLAGLLPLLTVSSGKAAVSDQNAKANNKNFSLTPFLILLIAMSLGGIVYRGSSVTIPAYFELKNSGLHDFLSSFFQGLKTPNLTATILTSMIYLFGMLGQYLGGRAGEKFDLRYGYLIFHLITIPTAWGMAISINLPLFVFTLIHSFFLLGMQPIENTLVARYTPPKLLSSAFGTKFVFTFGGGALSVKIIEYVRDVWGMEAIYFGLSGVSILLCGVILILIMNTRTQNTV